MSQIQGPILVTGATGHQGGAVARHLVARGHPVTAMTRKPDGDAARALQGLGVEVVRGDFDDEPSLESALRGVWGVFSVQNTWEVGVEREEQQGLRFAEIARNAGVEHFVYTSVGSAHRKTGIPHFENKYRIEQRVRSLGFPSHVILRPVFFMENWLGGWFKPALDQGMVAMAIAPSTPLQMIAVDDIGVLGALAFERATALNGRGIDLAGDTRTMPETAEVLGRAMGRTIRFAPPPIEEIRKASADYALMLEWFDRVGYDADIPGLEREFEVELQKLEGWAQRAVVPTAAGRA